MRKNKTQIILFALSFKRHSNFVSISIQCTLVFKLLLFDQEGLSVMFSFAGKYIYAKCNSSRSRYNTCNRMADQLIKDSIRTGTMVTLSMMLFVAVPMFLVIFLRQQHMIMPIILPFTDPESDDGFYLNFMHHIFFGTLGPCAIVGIEMCTCVNINAAMTAAAVIRTDLEDLELALHTNAKFTPERAQQFRNIIIEITDFHRYSNSAGMRTQ